MRKTILTTAGRADHWRRRHRNPDSQRATGASATGARRPAALAGPHWMGWMQRGHDGGVAAAMQRLRTFALVYRQEDRNLTPPDVQKIAEAFLLWNGNHTWKVVDVAPTADGAIGFSLATQEGSVIARFTMDPHTGRVTRTG